MIWVERWRKIGFTLGSSDELRSICALINLRLPFLLPLRLFSSWNDSLNDATNLQNVVVDFWRGKEWNIERKDDRWFRWNMQLAFALSKLVFNFEIFKIFFPSFFKFPLQTLNFPVQNDRVEMEHRFENCRFYYETMEGDGQCIFDPIVRSG